MNTEKQNLSNSKYVSKTEYAYQEIRSKILNDIYPPGTVLSTRDLSAQLAISRTPIKDAISRLAYEGYVELYPDLPAIVSKISFSDVIEMLEMRECLEGFSAYQAALRRTENDMAELDRIYESYLTTSFENPKLLTKQDQELHIKIACIANNGRLLSAIESIQTAFSRITFPISRFEDRFQRSSQQHKSVLEAIRQKNSELARLCMVQHIQDILHSVEDYQQNNIHLFR